MEITGKLFGAFIPQRRWQVLQPAIYLISFLPCLTVFRLDPVVGKRIPLILAAIGVVLCQHSINVLNDVTDWIRGADAEKELSWVRFHGENIHNTRWHGFISLLAGLLVGIFVLFKFGPLWVLLVALPLLALGSMYNWEKSPLSYTRNSEWVTGLCYGPGVFGCLYLVSGGETFTTWTFGSLAYAASSVSVLLSHQPPQALSDFLAGKKTFVVRFGSDKAVRWACTLWVISLASIFLIGHPVKATSWLLLILITTAAYFISNSGRILVSPKSILLSTLGVELVLNVLEFYRRGF